MGFYHHYIFPRVLDLAMSSRMLHPLDLHHRRVGRDGGSIPIRSFFRGSLQQPQQFAARSCLLSKRGVQLGGEFRYLLDDAHGENRLEYLPSDDEAGRSRWGVALKNEYRLNASTQAGMLFHRVSDDDYFRDLSNLISITSLPHLNQEAWVSTQHAIWNADLRVQTFQTLQDSTSTTLIEEP